jgi:hypothetical protein
MVSPHRSRHQVDEVPPLLDSEVTRLDGTKNARFGIHVVFIDRKSMDIPRYIDRKLRKMMSNPD